MGYYIVSVDKLPLVYTLIICLIPRVKVWRTIYIYSVGSYPGSIAGLNHGITTYMAYNPRLPCSLLATVDLSRAKKSETCIHSR